MNIQMLALVASILLSGCGASKRLKQKDHSSFFVTEDPKKFILNTQLDIANAHIAAENMQDERLSYDQIQSQFIDIPIPFSTTFIKAQKATKKRREKGICAQFESALELRDILTFYEREMELYGWINSAKYCGDESVFIFEKPNKTSIIIVQGHTKKGKAYNKINIFV